MLYVMSIEDLCNCKCCRMRQKKSGIKFDFIFVFLFLHEYKKKKNKIPLLAHWVSHRRKHVNRATKTGIRRNNKMKYISIGWEATIKDFTQHFKIQSVCCEFTSSSARTQLRVDIKWNTSGQLNYVPYSTRL